MHSAPAFDSHQWTELYQRGQHEVLADRFLEVLNHFHLNTYRSVGPILQQYVDTFVEVFLRLFCQPDFRLSDRHAVDLVTCNLTISNLAAMSRFQTTDPQLKMLAQQPNNVARILALWSARNAGKFDRRAFFEAAPGLTSLWYTVYADAFRGGLPRARVVANLQEHLAFEDARAQFGARLNPLYFGSTYVDGRCDRQIKQIVNRRLRDAARTVEATVQNSPDPRKIAVLSGSWWPAHSVYRNYYAYLKALTGYHLTFFRLGNEGVAPEVGLFHEVKQLNVVNGLLDIEPIRKNDFGLIYYPDVGMTRHSILLANMRLAPIQVASPGHSVSTWGAEIDYFISGADAELPEQPERNYSERLVLLPGAGVIHNRPLYTPRGRRQTTAEFVINCSCFAWKVNHGFCQALRKVVDGARKPLRFRLFVGRSAGQNCDFVPFARDVAALLPGAAVEVIASIPYPDYMARMEDGDICLDAYHFGGCNTVADSLYLRKPIVTWEGDKWYNRIGSQMLRLVGLDELAARSEDQYVNHALRLINDDSYRAGIEERLRGLDLDRTVFSTADAPYFQKGIDSLIANHARLKTETDRSAIRIER
ncbi:MAG: hypothetical protein K2R98_33320 [Gemmataceae bacterium]|nr:hypothetical protein [Gemmataceae bacterium]